MRNDISRIDKKDILEKMLARLGLKYPCKGEYLVSAEDDIVVMFSRENSRFARPSTYEECIDVLLGKTIDTSYFLPITHCFSSTSSCQWKANPFFGKTIEEVQIMLDLENI